MRDVDALVARLRIGSPPKDRPTWEVVWVQNLRAHFKDGMFSRQAFPEWQDIFRENFEALLSAADEAANEIECLLDALESERSRADRLEKALKRLDAYNTFECGSDVEHVRKIIRAYMAALDPAPGWQTMETAPKDGTWLFLYVPGHGPVRARWNKRMCGWESHTTGREITRATHCMHIPAAPMSQER